MMLAEKREFIKNRLMDIMEAGSQTIHIYYSAADGSAVQLSGKPFPGLESNPLEYFLSGGYVDEQYMPVFSIYCEKVRQGIADSISSNQASTEIAVKFPGAHAAVMCHFVAYFLRDDSGRITDIHYVLQPFSASENYNREAMKGFSADKNPRLFSERNARVIMGNPDKEIAFIQFDIERFRVINNTYGPERGDELLQFINDSLGVICTEQQSFCRLTADMFMIVTPFDDREQLIGFIRHLESRLSGYKDMEYRFVFGVSFVDDRTNFTRRFGDNASAARQSVKGNALENIGIFDESMKTRLEKRQSIEDDMYRALAAGDFVMFLQPKHSISTGRIIGAEALARWIHPEKGMISPADFIPVFEKNGFIIKLDAYIWESACKQIRSWIDGGTEPVPISVNISREYVRTADVTNMILELIHKYDIPISLLELEITESAEGGGVEEVVKKMKAAGFKMLMDDFGTGYSSLNMLKSTPFDILKIDKGFLDEFMESDRGRIIMEHTIAMSRDIGLDIIAEGVETFDQAQFLSGCGCDCAQGFFYSRPLPAVDFNKRLAEINNQ